MATRPSLEELLKGVPAARLNQPCKDECLCRLALSITKWHSIAPFLGLTDVDEEEISFLYPNELRRQTVAMLRKWKSKHGKKATYKRLARIFRDLAFTNVVEEICELLNSPDSSDSESDEGSAIEPEAVSELQVQQPQSADIGVLNSYAQYLRGRYSARLPTFLTLQWPPPPTKKVFNLAMIVKERIQGPLLDEELVKLTVRGNVDDIVARKTSVKLENIFDHERAKQRFVLVEGAPGAGKSTLAWHICQKWECGELFQEFRLVIFVQLREPAIQEAKSLVDLLPAKNEKMASDVVAQISACEGQGILFVVDSWDELPVQYHKFSIFEKLICYPESLNLHLSTLLITSRPIASGKLQPLVSSRIEIVGFTKSEVKEYFDSALGGSDLVQKLQDQLAERPVIEAACYLPLNAAIVVRLFLDYHTLPKTLHGVFTSLVVSCITRHLTKLSGKGTWDDLPRIESLDELPPEVEMDFCNICLLAYQGILKNQVTFSNQDLQSLQPTLSSQLNTLSLIQGTESFRRSILYNFLHLQIQELLAAFHISKLPPSEQVKIFKDLFGQSRFTAVFEFYAVFTKLETEGIREIVLSMVKGLTFHSRGILVSLLHCLYEAQDLSLCRYVVSLLGGKLDLSDTSLSPVDCLSVGYFLRCTCLTTTGTFEVELLDCNLDDYKIACVVRELSKCCNDRHVNFEIRLGSSRFPAVVLDKLYNPDVVQELPVAAIFASAISSLLCCCSIISLDFSRALRTLKKEELYHLSCAVSTNSSLAKLNLCHCSLQVTGINGPALTEMLKVNKTLQTLDMSENNGVADVGAFFIAEGLLHNSGLKHLKLRECGITAEGAKSIADALKVNSTLEHLNMTHNTIGDTGVADVGVFVVAEGLLHNCGLKHLELECCGITAGGTKSIADALKVNRTLECLNVNGNTIDDTGAVHMAEALKSNNALKRLELACCGLTEKGLAVLSASLVVNNCLQYLDIASHASCSYRGFGPLQYSGKCVLNCKSLKQFVSCLQENLHLTNLRLGPARDAPYRWDIVEGESSALNQLCQDRCLPELKIACLSVFEESDDEYM